MQDKPLNQGFLCQDGSAVFPVGQGGMGIGGNLDRDNSSDAKCIDALVYALEMGMNFIDTAEGYGDGHSEELIGQVVSSRRESVFIATKFSPENSSSDGVLAAAERSLKRLQSDYIDLYQIHWPNPAIPLEETLSALVRLLDDGTIRHIGVSNFSRREMCRAISFLGGKPLSSNQCEYNLFDRFADFDIIPTCREMQVDFIAYSPLDKGRTADSEEARQFLGTLSNKYRKTPSQIVLNWMVRGKGLYAIPMATRRDHIKLNAESISFELEECDFGAIDTVCSSKPVMIDPSSIEVSVRGEGSRKVYRTVEEALDNVLGFSPSPRELAADLLSGDSVKPVRVTKRPTFTNEIQYDLIEGRIRYWAWVIAYGSSKPIPAYVRSHF